MRILTESRHAGAGGTHPGLLVFQKNFRYYLTSTTEEPRLLIPATPDAPRLMSTAREVVPKAVDYGARDSNALWWLSTDRERARGTKDGGPLPFQPSGQQISGNRHIQPDHHPAR